MSGATVLIMAAGEGTRMRSSLPKMLHPVCGRPMITWPVLAAREAGAERVCVIVSPDRDLSSALPEGTETVVQPESDGTGGAIRAALDIVRASELVVVVNGDHPLITAELIADAIDAHREAGAAATVVTVDRDDPTSLGRVVRDSSGDFERIVETKYPEGIPAEVLAIHEVNTNTFAFDAAALGDAIERVSNDNAAGEYYIGDALRLIREQGARVRVHKVEDVSVNIGVNTRAELAVASAVARGRILERHMLAGVTVTDPEAAWVDADVEIEPDVTIHPFTVIRGDVTIASGVEIGPFAFVRPGTSVGENAKIGAFVEVKKSSVGARTKIPHLSYIGDAEIGENTNIAAGNVTANFKHEAGQSKAKTRIGSNVRTGVDNTFDAPVEVGDDAWLAPGAVITDDVPPGSLAGFAPRQVTKKGWVYEKHGNRDD